MTEKELKELIKKDMSKKSTMYTGRKFYNFKPKMGVEKIDTLQQDGTVKSFETKENKVYINWFKKIVKQKLDYLMSTPISNEIELSQLPEFNFNEIFSSAGLDASLDSRVWLHFFINEFSRLDWILVPDSEIITQYDKYKKYIKTVIRYYRTTEKNIRVEVWTKEGLAIYSIDDKDNIMLNKMTTHYTNIDSFNNEIEETKENFDMIPFIPLFNNKDKESDIEDIESLMYLYNSIASGFIDNIEKFQEALVKFIGFSTDSEDVKEAMEQLRILKGVGVPAGGDVQEMTIEIPTEPRRIILELLKSAIYDLGRGVDIKSLTGVGSNITNVLIKALMFDLDTKANEFAQQIDLFYKKIIIFINNYYKSNYKAGLTFVKAQIFNTSEMIQDNVNSLTLVEGGVLSKDTLMKNIPYITNIEEEKAKIELEKQNSVNV